MLKVLLAAATMLALEMSTPAQMAYFLGSWDCNGSFPSTGKTIASTISFESDVKLAGIIKHHNDLPPNGYHALEAWVYSASEHQYNAAIVDNFGGVRHFTSPGWDGDQLTWSSTPNEKPSPRTERFVYVKNSANEFRLDWQVSQDGAAYRVGDTLTCKRR